MNTVLLTKPNRVADKIIDLISKDKIDEVLTLLPYLSGTYEKKYKDRFIKVAITHCAEKCTIFFINSGAKFNMGTIFTHCKWNKILEVFEFCQTISKKTGIEFTHTKEQVIARILEPSKVDNNPERIEYFLQIAEKGFVTLTESKETIMNLHKNSTKPERIKRILRELSFYELGI